MWQRHVTALRGLKRVAQGLRISGVRFGMGSCPSCYNFRSSACYEQCQSIADCRNTCISMVTATAEVFSKQNFSDAAGGLQPQRCISDETAGTLAALCLDMGLGLTYRSPNGRPQNTPNMLYSLFGYPHNGNPDFSEPPINIQPPTRKPDPCAVVGKNQKELAVRELLGNFFLIAIVRKPQYLQNTRMSSSLNP